MLKRREFIAAGLSASSIVTLQGIDGSLCIGQSRSLAPNSVQIGNLVPDEDLIAYVHRVRGTFDSDLYRQILGAANEFKEGDSALGLAAENDQSRQRARRLLSRTKLHDIDANAPHQDKVYREGIACVEHQSRVGQWTLGELKEKLLSDDGGTIQSYSSHLSSDVIGCVCKLMTNSELIKVGSKIFNPLPGTKLGAEGYLGARIQPNSPTDHPDDIIWQVLDGWSYAVGDMLLGTNPVSSDPESVAAIERALKDLLETFELTDFMPHCVLSHIDIQHEVEESQPGSTALYFQSIGGCEAANETFDTSTADLCRYADEREGRYGLYFETGQGADYTNGHGFGFDMVLHESRKYGLARSLKRRVGEARLRSARHRVEQLHGGEAKLDERGSTQTLQPWVHLNDVAGFIGPEVFRTRDQLVRCCLEDIVMGKLHGLCIGLDVCSTLHMDISLDDLDWCLEKIMPACPAYLMALPTKIDPMLGYLTTGYQDHVRLRTRFKRKVNDPVWEFFKRLEVIDHRGKPTEHFGDPLWVYLKLRRAKQDTRTEAEIRSEGQAKLDEIRSRGVFIAQGCGKEKHELTDALKSDITRIYEDGKKSIWAELDASFVSTFPSVIPLQTMSSSREDYILHPVSGEQLDGQSIDRLKLLRQYESKRVDLMFVISDGLNALAIQERNQLYEYLEQIRLILKPSQRRVADVNLMVRSGRVRAGYQIGEVLFGGMSGERTIIHLIGERPGTGHRTFSAYVTTAQGATWGKSNLVDHNITKVISGIAHTALKPKQAAEQTVKLLGI